MKSKRRATLISKLHEFEHMTGCSVFLKIMDRDVNRSYVYSTDDLYVEYTTTGLKKSQATDDNCEKREVLEEDLNIKFSGTVPVPPSPVKTKTGAEKPSFNCVLPGDLSNIPVFFDDMDATFSEVVCDGTTPDIDTIAVTSLANPDHTYTNSVDSVVSDQDVDMTPLPDEPKTPVAPETALVTEAPETALVTVVPEAALVTETPETVLVTEAPEITLVTEAPGTALVTEAPEAALVTEAPEAALVTETPETTLVTEQTLDELNEISDTLSILANVCASENSEARDENLPVIKTPRKRSRKMTLKGLAYQFDRTPIHRILSESTSNSDLAKCIFCDKTSAEDKVSKTRKLWRQCSICDSHMHNTCLPKSHPKRKMSSNFICPSCV